MTSQKSFKPGDLVVCVDDKNFGEHLKKGVVYSVTGVSEPICNGDEWCISISSAPGNVFMKESRFKLYEKPEETIKPTFKVDDVVEWCGARGIVTKFDFGEHLSVRVKFDDNSVWSFTRDGRACDWHKTPSLFIVSRPKKMVTKTVEAWANVYSDGSTNYHDSKDEADGCLLNYRIACVKLTGEYEVEVDDE